MSVTCSDTKKHGWIISAFDMSNFVIINYVSIQKNDLKIAASSALANLYFLEYFQNNPYV